MKKMIKTVRYKNIEVNYSPDLDGGGMGFGQEFPRVIKEKMGKTAHIFEFCAGPGFIGFSLLAKGLCEKLTLADISPEAVKACEETIKKNNLQEKVSVYLSDCLDSIPETEKWDLVVGNPPHWPSSEDWYHADIKRFDPGLKIHKRFYKDIHKFLKPNGSILFQENGRATTAEDFAPIIAESGLEIIDTFRAKPASFFQTLLGDKSVARSRKPSPFYFIWSKVK